MKNYDNKILSKFYRPQWRFSLKIPNRHIPDSINISKIGQKYMKNANVMLHFGVIHK